MRRVIVVGLFVVILVKRCFVLLVFFPPDDGVSPERVAQVMGQPDHCHHAVHLINELVQTAQVPASHFLADAVKAPGAAAAASGLNLKKRRKKTPSSLFGISN